MNWCMCIALCQDEKVTQAEWFKIWSECIQANNTQNEMPEWCQKYMSFMFDVNDTSGNFVELH